MIREISAFELKNMMDAGRAPDILDVREPDEYAAGHIPGALNIPLGLLPVMTDEVDKGKTWHVICHSGARSAVAVQYLAGLGWNAVNVAGGMCFWTGAVERGFGRSRRSSGSEPPSGRDMENDVR